MKNIKKINFKEIELKNLSFEYNNSNNKIFNQINFKIKEKQTVGILGESGSGKTTFINILMGLLDIKKGTFNLNGAVLEEKLYDKIKISYIAQENLVLKESIKKNISLEIDEKLIDMIKLEEVIRFSNFDKVLQKNNLSLNSIIGENGLSLSGGESKRLSIARALYHNCDLLILDEALNSLDEMNKNEIRDNLKSIKSRIAMVIISHDKVDLKNCDMIYKIENGKINLLKYYEE
jgi:ABC-type bacteriocin/lantibiotic exporter with double-glycine peptidase domain